MANRRQTMTSMLYPNKLLFFGVDEETGSIEVILENRDGRRKTSAYAEPDMTVKEFAEKLLAEYRFCKHG